MGSWRPTPKITSGPSSTSTTRGGSRLAQLLADLLRDSLEHPSVNAARLAGDAKERDLSAETGRYFGSGALFADASTYDDERFMGVLTPAAFADPQFAQDINRYGAVFSVPLDLAGAIRASRNAALHDLAAARLAERQTTLLKLSDTTAAYVQLQALLRQQRVLAVQRNRVTQTVERVTLEVETQQYSVAELRLAQAELSRLRSDEIRLSGAIEFARERLGDQRALLHPARERPQRGIGPSGEPHGLERPRDRLAVEPSAQ